MNDQAPAVAFETTAKIEAAKRDLVFNSLVSVLMTVVVIVFLSCATSYCSLPETPKPLDREAQAIRLVENNKLVACVRAGSAWLPVTVRDRAGGVQTTEMSCVPRELAEKVILLNNRKDN